VVEETGLGAGVLDDPVTGIVWLVHRLARYGAGAGGGGYRAVGQLHPAGRMPAGQPVEADFGPFGATSVRFG
jgi:2-oxo-hept-3-ene-1,7-dioate hydratase